MKARYFLNNAGEVIKIEGLQQQKVKDQKTKVKVSSNKTSDLVFSSNPKRSSFVFPIHTMGDISVLLAKPTLVDFSDEFP
jgi:hypothetical protein